MISAADLFLFKIVFSYSGYFCMKSRNVLSRSVKNCVGILMGTALNVQIAFGRVDIIAVLCVFYAFNCW